jgi:hypothetical protein
VPPNFITTISPSPLAASAMAYKDSFRTVGRLSSYGRRRLVALLAVVAVVAAVAVAVLAGGGHKQAHVPEASSGKPRQRVSFLSRIVPPAEVPERHSRTLPNVARSVQDLARRLPVGRKVAQLFLVGFKGTDLTADVFQQLRRLDLGGIVVDRSGAVLGLVTAAMIAERMRETAGEASFPAIAIAIEA